MSETPPAPEAAPAAAAVVAAPAAAPSKVVPILVGLNSLLVVGMIALVVLKGGLLGGGHGEAAKGGGEHDKPKDEHAAPAGPGPMVRLADFVVRLRDPEVDRYARMSFDVEVATELDKTAFTARVPQVRDVFIGYLSDRSLEELRGREALERTKLALTAALTHLMPETKIRGIYISEFVVQ